MAGDKRDRGTGIFATAAAGAFAVSLAMTVTAAQGAAPGAGVPPQGPQWIKLCSPDPMTKKNLCLVQQEIYADTGQFIASVIFRSVQDDPKMQFIIGVPTGMMIQPGVQMKVDEGKQSELKYSICFPNQCFADM